MKIDVEKIIESRRDQRRLLVARAEDFAAGLDPTLGVQAVVVFGSVARGDFNVWSDVDVLVVADHLQDRHLDRARALGPGRGAVSAVAWTPEEFLFQLTRDNPIARESVDRGVWLVGTVDDLTQGR